MVINAIPLLVVVACASRGSANFQIIRDSNRTTIDYEPPEAWKSSTQSCSDCPVPPSSVLLDGNSTWTNGTNAPPKVDEDDLASPRDSKFLQLDKGKDDDGDHGKDGDDNPDSDDPNFVQTPVTVTFRFSASSFALHALIPTFILPSNAPSNTNISFMLDGLSTGPAFINFPSKAGNGFTDQAILQLQGLTSGPHVVVGNLAPGSTFIVSYVNLSTPEMNPTSPSTSQGTISNDRLVTSDTSSPTASASSTLPPVPKKNVMSFAALIGSVVGVLAIISFSIFLSLCYRRRVSKKRLSRIRAEEEAAEIREFGARVHGPQPFRPRYFPGTLPPFDEEEAARSVPPPYIANAREGTTVMISPLPPPPPPPPPPPIHREENQMQVREVGNGSLISITPVASPPVSMRRSSVISAVLPDYPGLSTDGEGLAEGSLGSDAAADTSEGGAEATQEGTAGTASTSEPTPSSRRSSLSTPVRRHRPQQSTEPREDETSDSESGGLLSSDPLRRPSTPRPVYRPGSSNSSSNSNSGGNDEVDR